MAAEIYTKNIIKAFKNHINNTINELVNAMKACELSSETEKADWYEAVIDDYKSQLYVLDDIIKCGEGNLIRFNGNGTFKLWAIHCAEDSETVIECYDDDMSFDTYEECIELSKCRDVSDAFDFECVMPLIIVTDEPQTKSGFDGYLLVPEDALM